MYVCIYIYIIIIILDKRFPPKSSWLQGSRFLPMICPSWCTSTLGRALDYII